MSYMEYLQWDWMYVVTYSLLAITGIVFSIIFLNKKKSFAIFSLIGFILSLVYWLILNYLISALSYKSNVIPVLFLFCNILVDILLFVAIFSERKGAQIAPPQYPAYPYNLPAPQPPYTTAAQAQGYPIYPQQPQPPQEPPQTPQNPPLPHP